MNEHERILYGRAVYTKSKREWLEDGMTDNSVTLGRKVKVYLYELPVTVPNTCENCKHWLPTSVSDSGYYCSAITSTRCPEAYLSFKDIRTKFITQKDFSCSLHEAKE